MIALVRKYRRNIGALLLVAYLVLENQTNLFREHLLVKCLSVAGLFLATLLLFWGTLDVLGSRVLRYARGE